MRVASFLAPVENEYQTEEHASQVGEVGDVVAASAAAAYAEEELDESVADDKIFGLDGYGYEHEEKFGIGKQHAEGQQYAEYRTRGTDGNDVVEHEACLFPTDCHLGVDNRFVQGDVPGEFLHQTCAYAGGHVEDEKPLAPPYRFKGASEHEDREHIEEYVPEGVGVVHEHVGYELGCVETVGLYVVQAQIFDKVYTERLFKNNGC